MSASGPQPSRDIPIIFSGPMVSALLDGRKTQMRRLLNPQPPDSFEHPHLIGGRWFVTENEPPDILKNYPLPVRYRIGDRLWVREKYWITELDEIGEPFLVFDEEWTDGMPTPGEKRPCPFPCPSFGPHPSIHMPRWASRLTLTVTDVRVQRLQDISEEDAVAEGVESPATERYDHDWSICPQCGGTMLYNGLSANLGVMPDCDCNICDTHRKRYQHLWNRLHSVVDEPPPWDADPWIVAVTFTVERRNIDAREAA